MAGSYVYTPLKGNHDIRVFSFTSSKQKRGIFSRSRSSSGSLIEGHLNHVSLDKSHSQPYIALSYTWGNPFPPELRPLPSSPRPTNESITLEGQCSAAGENLHEALLALRTLKFPCPIWIDALSINQKNLNERNAQVGMMGDVYARAATVYVWLGPHDSASRIAMGAFQRFDQAVASMPLYGLPKGRYTFNDHHTFFRLIHCAPFNTAEWQAIVDFFSRTWFHRAWIAQEIALSIDCIFLCGESQIPKETIKLFVDWMCHLQWTHVLESKRRDQDVHLKNGITAFFENLQLGYFVQTGLKNPKLQVSLSRLFGVPMVTERELFYAFAANVLFKIQHRQASDPRDKVFAPLALAKMTTKDQDLAKSLPSPDYSSSVEDVYTRVTSFLIIQLGNPCFLSFIERNTSEPLSLPSWVPNYNAPTVSRSLSTLSHNATKSWVTRTSPEINHYLLKVKGLLFDTVTRTCTSHLDQYADLTPLLDMACQYPDRGPSNEHRLEELFRTLVQDEFSFHWLLSAADSGQYPPMPFQMAADSFKDWIIVRVGLHAFRVLSSTRSKKIHIPQRVLDMCGTTPLFPTAAELHKCVSELIASMQPGHANEAYRKDILALPELFEMMISGYADRRSVICTKRRSLLGLGPLIAKEGDEIWYLHGARVPFFLRKLPNGHRQLVGEAYVHGFMQGEFLGRDGLSVTSAVDVVIE